jgi:hypothetical protein
MKPAVNIPWATGLWVCRRKALKNHVEDLRPKVPPSAWEAGVLLTDEHLLFEQKVKGA